MLVIAILIKRDGGPVFYTQKRVTRGGREFDLYKFRTMIPDAEKLTGPVLAQKDDPRVTKIGKKLRQTRLDEIPQLWNTLKGDMSLVGPRPEREHFIELYKESIPEYEYRTFVRAGITGLAHVFGKYNTTPEERIKLDLTYMQNYSIFLDLKIMIETLRVIFTKDYAEGVEQSSGAEKAAAPGKTEKAAVKQAAAQATNPATGKAAGQAAWETVGHMEKRAVNLTGNPAAKPPVRQRKGKA
jgi:lipopolysaccharide/colanic/teichoic acid biosynthesis glycosyltransferase